MTIEEEIAWKIRNDCGKYIREGRSIAATIMPVVRRAQAEALREASRAYGLSQISGFFPGPEGYTKAWLDDRADRIEQNSEGNET